MTDFGLFTLGFAGWVGVVCLPPALAVWFWNRAPRYLGQWLPHIVFAPIVLAAEWGLVRLLFFVTGDTGEGTPGLGLALVPAAVVLMSVLAVYYSGVTIKAIKLVWAALYIR